MAKSQTPNRHTLSGFVRDSTSGETLVGASVIVTDLQKGVVTNEYGFYSIKLDEGIYNIRITFIGYGTFEKQIDMKTDVRLNVNLKEQFIDFRTIEITGERADENIQSVVMGKEEIKMETIKSLPAFMGEVDILKSIQLLPGVQSAGEGNTGYYVRGGGPDQNLVLLDEAPIYNASHLFGFFSVFNADAIKNVSLYKGSMPAKYGGRLASVLDISMKEGNSQKLHGEGGLGFIASRLTLEGPIIKERASFIFSARRTFVDLFMREPFIEEGSTAAGNSYYFYDLNGKINYRISDKDRIFLSGYLGKDAFKFKSKATGFSASIPWGNAAASVRWNHLFRDNLFLNTSAIFSQYRFAFSAGQETIEFKLFSGINDYTLKTDFTWYPKITHNVKFGAQYTYHIFTPSTVEARSGETQFDLGDKVKLYSYEGAAYIQDDWDVTEDLAIGAGLRYTYFNQVGPFKRYVQNESLEITDTVFFEDGESVQMFNHLEPRLNVRYTLNKNSSVKASYTKNYQYVHVASLSSASLPTDVWVPSSSRVKPQEGSQYAFGYFRNFKNNLYETSVEVYYKDLKNQIEYREGAQPDDDIRNNQDNNFVFGKGWSYGAEFFLKKARGKLNGWIGYTLAWTERKFPDLNKGKMFPAKYDRRHDVSVALTYELNSKWTFGAVWVYATGNALTLPQSRLFINGPVDVGQLVAGGGSFPQIYYEYGERNSYRQPAYHRLDISATLKVKKRRKWEASWNFSIFNVYNRYNPYFIYFDDSVDESTGQFKLQAKQVSLFPIIPSITYNFKF
jgi:outer membrane receptor for ferrienterochelin and colicin